MRHGKGSLCRALLGAGTAIVLAVAIMPLTAVAYVGPGAGLSAIGSFLALLGAIAVTILGFVWYPLKRILGKRRRRE